MSIKKEHGIFNCIYFLISLFVLFSIYCADYDLLDEDLTPPDAVELSISKVTDSSVTLVWTKCDNDSFLNYIVLYSTGSYVGNDGTVFDTLSYAVDTVVTIKSLGDLTEYAFRVIVSLSNGTSTPSSVVDTTTLENMDGKLKLTWTVDNTNVQLLWTKSVTSCNHYRIFSDTTATVDSTDTLIKIITDTTFLVTGLIPEKRYWYRVYARDDLSFVAVSNIVEVLFTEAP